LNDREPKQQSTKTKSTQENKDSDNKPPQIKDTRKNYVMMAMGLKSNGLDINRMLFKQNL
jgi:hypothetical protein